MWSPGLSQWQRSKDVESLKEEIERLNSKLNDEFERGKSIGKMIGWAEAKADSYKAIDSQIKNNYVNGNP